VRAELADQRGNPPFNHSAYVQTRHGVFGKRSRLTVARPEEGSLFKGHHIIYDLDCIIRRLVSCFPFRFLASSAS